AARSLPAHPRLHRRDAAGDADGRRRPPGAGAAQGGGPRGRRAAAPDAVLPGRPRGGRAMNRRLQRGLIAAVALAAACANALTSDSPLEESRRLIADGRGDEGLAMLEKLQRENPEQRAWRAAYFRERDRLFVVWLAQAETLAIAGQYAQA